MHAFPSFLFVCLLLSLPLSGVQIWQEGEHATHTNWSSTALFLQPDGKGASNHRVLKLFSDKQAEELERGYVADYLLDIPEAGRYHLWVAMSEPSASWSSPISILVDGELRLDASACRWLSAPFGLPHPGRVLGWVHPGALQLAEGRHRLTFQVTGPRPSDGRFVAFLDGFLLTTSESVRPPSNYRICPELQPSWQEVIREAGSYQQLANGLKYGHEVWQEAEGYLRTNWNGKVMLAAKNGSGASGAMYLRLYTTREPDSPFGYYADYDITIPAEGDYHLWLSLANPGSSWASPVKAVFDGQHVLDTAGIRWPSRPYGNGQLGWVSPGKVRLAAGRHRVSIRVTERRRMSPHYLSFFDGFYLCTGDFTPVPGNYRIAPNLQPSWEETLARAGSFRRLKHQVEKQLFQEVIADIAPQEMMSEEEAQLVERRLKARPLPGSGPEKGAIHRFGLHGMEKPFVLAEDDAQRTERLFEMLARAGVDTLRTAELCWHRLGTQSPASFDFREIDLQVRLAHKYGMNFMFTIGYPPAAYNYDRHHLSTFKPEHEGLFRDYLRLILPKYDRYAQYWEYANEVDAPQVWWRKATPEDYARDCRIIREEMSRLNITTPLLGLAATYSRTDKHDDKGEGQAFARRALSQGLDRSLDGFSLHYAWPLRQRPFVEFFRGLAPEGPSRRLVNSEEAGYTHPSDIIKLFARNFYLHGMESVYYYVSRDWIEIGNPIYGGLFDMDWRPKHRLLSLAVAADAMKTRTLVAMAEPLPHIEAYLLNRPGDSDDNAIILWLNGGDEAHGSRFTRTAEPQPVSLELPAASVQKACSWRLDDLAFNPDRPTFTISAHPIVIYCRQFPDWKRLTPAQWSQAHPNVTADTTEANIPGQ